MIRNAFYGNDKGEFLLYCEKGVLPAVGQSQGGGGGDPTFRYDLQTPAHLLVGIEPAGGRADPDRPLWHGIDNMAAVELRNWFLTTFWREINMLKLLSAAMAVQKLADEAEAEIV
ncbi:hypothetical protein GGS20DRAFT_589709 [Poronia punctata]|nr:hypothetical protein GGS20DRAFT_589709 [Poronia punctata]